MLEDLEKVDRTWTKDGQVALAVSPTRQYTTLEGLEKADRNRTKDSEVTLFVSLTRQIETLDGPLARQIATLLESQEDTELKLDRLQLLEVQVEN